MAVFENVLVATDFSEASRPALDLAIALAREPARLHVVHVCEVPAYVDLATPVDLVTPLTEADQKRLDDLMASVRAEHPDADGLLRVGVAWEQILEAAADVGADLVVLGTHGRRGLAHALLGSVAERVVRLASAPVLTVRPPPPAAPAAGR